MARSLVIAGQGAGNVGNNFEIDIQEGGALYGSVNPNQVLCGTLHMGSFSKGFKFDAGIDLSASFNTYAINWIPGKSITWYFNGEQVFQVTSAETTIPNEPMELIMSNQVNPPNKSSWHTILDSSTPQSMKMQIADVQLYQSLNNSDSVLGANVPTLSITSGGGLTNQTTQVITGAAEAGLTVSIYDGTTLLGTTTAAGDGAWSTSVSLLSTQGAQSITATAADAAGNVGTSDAVGYTLDNVAPTLSITSGGGLTNQTTQVITGAAEAGLTVSIYDGKTLLGTTTADGDGRGARPSACCRRKARSRSPRRRPTPPAMSEQATPSATRSTTSPRRSRSPAAAA